MQKLPSVKAIQTFEVTARHLSFSRAANELCISQSAVSHQIKSLEQALGKQLFLRSNNQVSLTCYGDALYSVASDSFKRLQAITHNLIEQNTLKLKVMAQSAIAVDWLAPRLPWFKKQNPGIDVALSMAISDLDFDAADYDVVIGSWPVPANFVTQKLRVEQWYPVCTPTLFEHIDPNDPVTLLQHSLFSSENGQDWALWMQAQKLGNTLQTDIQHFSNTILASKAALSGLGIALSCGFIADDAIRQGLLIPIKAWSYELPWGHFSIHYRSGSHLSEQIETLLSWLMQLATADE
ncbi:MAG: LysR family transcriptional regulator [Aestuariibacter sp.]